MGRNYDNMNVPESIHCFSGRIHQPDASNPIIKAHLEKVSSTVHVQFYEINDQQIYAPLFRSFDEGLVLLDIGSNIGLVSIYAADVCSRIVALEPCPETFTVLREMVKPFPQIEILPFALTPEDGRSIFYENDTNTTANSIVNRHGKMTSVDGIRLSTLLNQFNLTHVDVCKIDIEGAEGTALTIEELTMVEPMIESYHIEVHNCPDSTWQDKLGQLVTRLSMIGYHQMSIHGNAVTARKPAKQ